MTTNPSAGPVARAGGLLRRRMQGRSPTEEHRAATTLELFFDLCFVVAVAQAASQLEHEVVEAHVGAGIGGYAGAFFAIWWAWLNFTWFSSAYDTDDVPYRLMTMVQIAGALVLAAGVPRAFDEDYSIVTLGYVVMRVAQVGQWLRAAAEHPETRQVTLRYAAGIGVVQLGWVLRLLLPDSVGMAAFGVLVLAELAVPAYAEARQRTSWHPGHIAERYGLFTIIVLGESVLAATTAVQAAFDAGDHRGAVLEVAAGGMLVVFAMWWVYFASATAQELLTTASRTGDYRPSFLWGYGHYVIFASAAAVGAGLTVAVASAVHEAHIAARSAGLAVTIPVALYVLSVWLLHARRQTLAYPVCAALVLATPLLGDAGQAVLVAGLIMAPLVAITITTGARTPA